MYVHTYIKCILHLIKIGSPVLKDISRYFTYASPWKCISNFVNRVNKYPFSIWISNVTGWAQNNLQYLKSPSKLSDVRSRLAPCCSYARQMQLWPNDILLRWNPEDVNGMQHIHGVQLRVFLSLWNLTEIVDTSEKSLLNRYDNFHNQSSNLGMLVQLSCNKTLDDI